MKKHDHDNFVKVNGALFSLGINLAVGMFFFAGIGYYLDLKFDNQQNLYTLMGAFLGLGYCGYEIWKIIKNSDKENK